MKDKFIHLFGEEWYEQLKPLLSSNYFKTLAGELVQLRKIKTIYPEKEDIFKAFRTTPFNHLLRGVIISQDPYHDGSASGLCFGIKYGTTKIPPSLRRIKEEVISDCYDGEEWPFDYTLQKWANQGILMLNTALTVESGTPGSHLTLWVEFINTVYEILNTKNDLVYLCMGNDAKTLVETKITNLSCAKIIVGHPSPLNTKIPFLGTKPFSRFNEELNKRNIKEIVW